MLSTARARFARFVVDRKAATNVIFAVSLVPVASMAGAGVDYSRSIAVKTQLQNSLDAAVLSAARQPTAGRDTFAANMFASQKPNLDGTVHAPAFVLNGDGSYSGTATATVNTKIMSLIGAPTMAVKVTAKASKYTYDESCILAYGKGIAVNTSALTLNGGPSTDFTGCNLMSNSSMTCNGLLSGGDADRSISVGLVGGHCENPNPGAQPVPDIYATLKSNINRQCAGSSYSNITWSPTAKPGSGVMYTVTTADRTQYHVCGSLTLTGTTNSATRETLFGTSDTSDIIIVIENGSLTIDNKVNLKAARTTFVLTAASDTGTHAINFPNGTGQKSTLEVSPSRSAANPWRGMAMYQDPDLTTGVDITWGPGADKVIVDGVIYFPNAEMTMHGSGASGGAACTKIAVNKFTLNGNVDFTQTDAGCAGINMDQYKFPVRLM